MRCCAACAAALRARCCRCAAAPAAVAVQMSCDTSTLDYQKGVMLYQSYKRPHMPSTAAKPKGVEEGSAAVKGVKGKKSFEATLKESAEPR